jgi:molybdate transport repressor ModE-like protein
MIAALIITSGITEHNAGFEPLKKVGTITAIERIVIVFQRAGVDRIVVVSDGGDTDKLAARMNIDYLYVDKNGEMFDNVKLGLSYLQDKCTAVLITHVGVPLFSVETVKALMDSEEEVCSIPSYRGKLGHPLFLRAENFQTVLSYTGDGGLDEAIKQSGLCCRFVQVKDAGTITRLETSEDYEHLLIDNNLSRIQLDARIRLVKEKPFFGPGTYQLLQLIEETHSLRQACIHMGISYSKGRGIISIMDEQLGYPVIESQQGGKTGGYSTLTKEGKELMQSYTEFCTEAERCLQELFEKYFSS